MKESYRGTQRQFIAYFTAYSRHHLNTCLRSYGTGSCLPVNKQYRKKSQTLDVAPLILVNHINMWMTYIHHKLGIRNCRSGSGKKSRAACEKASRGQRERNEEVFKKVRGKQWRSMKGAEGALQRHCRWESDTIALKVGYSQSPLVTETWTFYDISTQPLCVHYNLSFQKVKT